LVNAGFSNYRIDLLILTLLILTKMQKLFFITLLAFTVVLTSSCRRSGCTDPDSINYDDKAKTNDNSCEYEGKVVFWYGQSTANGNVADGTTSLTFYLDGQVIGSSAADVYWSSSPDCGASGSISATKKLGFSKEKSYKYEVKDQDGDIIWSNNITLTGNKCLEIKLI
jgi:hypothetical protein